MEYEATTQSMSSSGTPGSHLVPIDSADSSQLNSVSSEYSQYYSTICITGANLSRIMNRDDKCAETSDVIIE